MITARVEHKPEYWVLELAGHSEYNPGNDIVCAGASSLAYTLAQAVCDLDIPHDIYFELGDARIIASPQTKSKKRDTELIFKAFCKGLVMLEEQYPDNIQVEVTEG